jgi:uroporphyrinogen-III synthase
MTRPIAVLRPEPGNRATVAAIGARGFTAIPLPLFQVRPLSRHLPDPSAFDALILTSANAVRHGGDLRPLASLPVFTVGDATAKAARSVGLNVVAVGASNAADLLAQAKAAGIRRALHLTGRDHLLEAGGIIAALIPVYASEPLAIHEEALGRLSGSVALIQSARAGERLRALLPTRTAIRIAAISQAAASAAGDGWQQVAIAPAPTTAALLDTAIRLAD